MILFVFGEPAIRLVVPNARMSAQSSIFDSRSEIQNGVNTRSLARLDNMLGQEYIRKQPKANSMRDKALTAKAVFKGQRIIIGPSLKFSECGNIMSHAYIKSSTLVACRRH